MAFGWSNAQPVYDGVVFAREEGMQHGQADPPIAVDTRQLKIRTRLAAQGSALDWQQAVSRQGELAVVEEFAGHGVGANEALALKRGAVDLRGVPPACLDIGVGGRTPNVGRKRPIWVGRQYRHPPAGPVISRREGNLVGMRIPAIGAVAQPVVDHELDPSRNKHIEMRDRYEIAPR